ncbi:MAG: hypothetical protein ABL901_03600 [Hyphomicrobiaceae bacterium]
MQDTPAKFKIRIAADVIAGLFVFYAISVVILGPSAASSLLGIESAIPSAAQGSTGLPLFVHQMAGSWEMGGTNTKFLMLAAVFSALFALNKAFARHLRKAYIRSHKVVSKPERE